MEEWNVKIDKFNRIFDNISASLCSLFFIALGAHGMYKYPQDVYRLYENHQEWYKSEALGLLLLFTAMFFGGCVAARYYYQQFFGGKQTIPDETAAVMEGRKRRDKIATICLALFTILAGIIPLIYGWREYLLLAPRQVPKVALAELLQKSPEGLIEVTGRFKYQEVWRENFIKNNESEEVRDLYYYPFTDMSAKQQIYVASHMEPRVMKERYGDREHAIRGLWHVIPIDQIKNSIKMEMNSYLHMQKEMLKKMSAFDAEREKKWKANQQALSTVPYIRTGMRPFYSFLNLVGAVDDPGISPWIFPFFGLLFGIPLIALGISWLKPVLRK